MAISNEPWVLVDDLRCRDPAAVEPSIAYLEADPWAFRTGYVKARLLRHLRKHDLDRAQRDRLGIVLLRTVDVGYRGEYAEACRLARHVDLPDVRDGLVARLHGADAPVALRALQMLLATDAELTDADLARARAVVVQAAASRRRPPAWLPRAFSPLWYAAWTDALRAQGDT